ncbi:MAG: AsmA family protein, partial [Pseudomonadota bacterium]
MKRFFIGLVATALLLLGVLFVAPGLVPSETYKARMEEQLSRMLGRDVALQGEVSLSTFPAIRARTGQATVANPPGFDREDMITLESLEARIRLLPLLSRRVEIAQFTLLEPDIYLARLPDGRANWDFASDGADAGAERDPAEPVEAFRRDGRFSAFQPSVDSLRIQDGRLSFQDAVSGRSHLLANIDVRIALPDMAQTLDIDGSLSADGTPVTVDLVLDNPRAFLDGREAPLKGSVEAAGVEARVDGTVAESPDMVFNGNVSGRLTDRARIEEWLPEPVSGLELVDEVNVSAAVSYDGSTGAARFE